MSFLITMSQKELHCLEVIQKIYDQRPGPVHWLISFETSRQVTVTSLRHCRHVWFPKLGQAPKPIPLSHSRSGNGKCSSWHLQGLSNKHIGLKLDLHEKTIKHHMTQIFTKLGVSNRTEAAMAFRDEIDPRR